MTAAFVLSPKPRPSTKPAPTATMFYRETGAFDILIKYYANTGLFVKYAH